MHVVFFFFYKNYLFIYIRNFLSINCICYLAVFVTSIKINKFINKKKKIFFYRDMENFWISGAIQAIKAVSFVCDFFTYPVYLLLHRPWEKKKLSRRIKAKSVYKDEKSIIYRNVDQIGSMHSHLAKEKIETLESMLKWVAKIHGDKKCLGTRQILAEEDEVQPNGRVFKKVNF